MSNIDFEVGTEKKNKLWENIGNESSWWDPTSTDHEWGDGYFWSNVQSCSWFLDRLGALLPLHYIFKNQMEFKLELSILSKQNSQDHSQTTFKKKKMLGSLLENSRFYGEIWFNMVWGNNISILIIYWMIFIAITQS